MKIRKSRELLMDIGDMEIIDYVPDYLEDTAGYMREMLSGSRGAGQGMEIRMSKYWDYDIPLTASLHFCEFTHFLEVSAVVV